MTAQLVNLLLEYYNSVWQATSVVIWTQFSDISLTCYNVLPCSGLGNFITHITITQSTPFWTVEDKKKLEKELNSIIKREKKGKSTKKETKKKTTTKTKKARVQKEAEWMFVVCHATQISFVYLHS